jgi:aspartyl-tRNA(Asn)/glutamyl-tRNA(Gln) amidotransferase subunit C
MSLDTETVTRIAYLARMKVADDQLPALARELSAILGFVEQLAEVDTADVAPMTSVADVTPSLRADRVTDGGNVDAVLVNAPRRVGDFYAVPKVVE